MSKHTPGPWRWDDGRCSIVADVAPDWWVEDGDEPPITSVAYLRGAMGGADGDRALMVAAPDMYAALRAIAEYDTATRHGYIDEWTEAESFRGCQEMARAALAKAEGETNV